MCVCGDIKAEEAEGLCESGKGFFILAIFLNYYSWSFITQYKFKTKVGFVYIIFKQKYNSEFPSTCINNNNVSYI